MNPIRSIIRKGYLTLAVLIMALTPLGALANVSADDSCNPPAQSSYGPGVHQPSGAESKAFTFQCGDDNPYQGLWTSARYIYYPITNTTQPIDPVVYTYNDNTAKYDYSYWDYVTTSNSYRSVDAATANPPAPGLKVKIVGAPKPAAPPATTPITANDAGGSSVTANANAGNNGNGSNDINNSTNNNGTITNTNGVNVTNTIGSTATSGNATVIGNTNAGNATTGDVISQAQVTNMLQSSSNALGSGSNVATFTYNIDGDVFGDLLFDPSSISNVQGDTNVNNSLNNNLVINNTSDATINNNLTLTSNSGDATVADNTNAGSATSGSAKSVADIINSIRSAVTAGKSFVGTINITGNLNGDILLPDNFADQLLAANVPTVGVTAPGSTNSNTTSVTDHTTVNNTNNQGISNNVNSIATTGNADVSDDTNAGSAHTGKASTNVTAFNLTGSHVVAKNSILVYVNVLGKWTGFIVNAPAGATAAALGGNVTENNTVNNNSTINNNTNQQINNNVNVTATSGNATVKDNTGAGDANTGDAQTAVNLTNIEDSSFQLSDWFGILYINVFGTWNGSFGVNTSAGDMVGGYGADEPGQTMLVGNVGKLVHYSATAARTTSTPNSAAAAPTSSSTTATPSIDNGSVLAAQTKKTASTTPKLSQSKASKGSSLWLPAIGAVLALGILGSERLLSRRRI